MAFKLLERKHLMSLLFALLGFILVSLFFFSAISERMELSATDYMFQFRDPAEYQDPEKLKKQLPKGVDIRTPNKNARKDIVIIGIDESTIRQFSDQGIHWPFPWTIYEKFIRYIGSGNPLAILIDITFLDHKKDEDRLAKAMRESGNVFLDYNFESQNIGKDYKDQQKRVALLNRMRLPVDPEDRTREFVSEVVPPTPMLSEAAAGIGFANVFIDPDNILRTMPLIIKWNGWYYPNIDLVVIMHYFGIGAKDVEIKWGRHIKLKNLPPEKMAKPNAKREIVIPIDDRGFMNINYIGGYEAFNFYSYRYFYRDGKMDNTSLKDKIILVAAYAVTGIASDDKPSPMGASFGIDHHANTLNTILNQTFIHKLTDWQNILILLIISAILGLVVPRMSIIASLVFTSAFSIAYLIAAYLVFHFFSYIPAFFTPLILSGFSFTLIVTYRVLTEQKEKRFIKQTFSKFVSNEVVDELIKNPEKLKLGGEKKIVTVLFSDIRGFTTISERMPPERLVDHLNSYLQAMTDIVIKYNGTLDKYVGDEIMAFWGAPVPQDDHAVRACRAALEMMSKLHEMNKVWKEQNKDSLDIGIGINSGAMVVGFVGSSSRMDYTLMGDMVNLGARLEGTNKIYKTNIIISEFTYEQARDQIIARELDLIRVKGKERPVKIYELINMKNS